MPGTLLAAGIVATTALLAAGLAAAGGASIASQRVAGAADAAALAAADAASGAVTGEPCTRAAELAAAAGAHIERCEIEGLYAVVDVSVPYAGLAATARARAGPAPGSQ